MSNQLLLYLIIPNKFQCYVVIKVSLYEGNSFLCVLLNHSSQIFSTVKRSGIERENKKGLTSRETAIPLWFDLFQSSHI